MFLLRVQPRLLIIPAFYVTQTAHTSHLWTLLCVTDLICLDLCVVCLICCSLFCVLNHSAYCDKVLSVLSLYFYSSSSYHDSCNSDSYCVTSSSVPRTLQPLTSKPWVLICCWNSLRSSGKAFLQISEPGCRDLWDLNLLSLQPGQQNAA